MDRVKDEAEQDDRVNSVGAAGQSADTHVAQVVSGMPAGGPHDLGERAADKGDDAAA